MSNENFEHDREHDVWIRVTRPIAERLEALLSQHDSEAARSVHLQLAAYGDDRRNRYVEAARGNFEREGSLEIDEDAAISILREVEDGAYVQAWVWVDRESSLVGEQIEDY